jgi:regulatory protein
LRVELRQKGIDDEIVENALHDIDEESNAQAAGRLALRRLATLEEPVFRRRLLGLLLRRGFSYGVARQVTDDLWQEVRAQQEANPE